MKNIFKSKLIESLRWREQTVSDLGLFFGKPFPSEEGKIVGLTVQPYGRMGNNLLQISNAILLARALGLNYLRLPETQILKLPEPATINGLTLLPPGHSLKGYGGFLTSGFFRETRLERLGCTMETRRRVIQKYIVPHLNCAPTLPEARCCLTIHIRSGDVFDPNPHPGYPQPPLSFYKKAIEDAQKKLGITQVQLVFEDRKNPCIPALEEYIKHSGLSLRIQCGTLLEDVAVLLSAPNLVFGYGTFGLGICLLSKVCESIYVFGPSGYAYSKFSTLKNLTVYDDISGIYPRVGEWKGTEEQLNLMVTLPQSAVIQVDENKPDVDGDAQWWTHLDTEV